MKKLIIGFLIVFLNATDNNLLTKAVNAMKQGNYKEALDNINKANSENLKNPDIYRMKALIHETLDNKAKAKKAWKKCLKYSTDNNMKREAKIHIKNLSNKH